MVPWLEIDLVCHHNWDDGLSQEEKKKLKESDAVVDCLHGRQGRDKEINKLLDKKKRIKT